MGNWRDRWRILFGRTPVIVTGRFGLEETIDRLNIVISPRFYSVHLSAGVKGHVSGRHFQIMWGSHPGLLPEFGLDYRGGGGVAYPSLSGELVEKNTRAIAHAYVEVSTADKINAALLLAVMTTSSVFLFFFWADGEKSAALLFGGILLPGLFLKYFISSIKEQGETLARLLRWAMNEPHE